MRSMKKLASAAALLAVGSLVLSGCGDSSSTPAPKKTEGPVTIEYWHRLPDKEGMITVETAAKEFSEKNPDIQVKAIKFEGDADASYQKITSAIKAGNAPCLAQASYDGIPAMLVRGELMDVTKQAEQYKDNYAAGPWGQASPGGKTYGIPQDTGPLVYYYDQAEFDKLGLKAPTTWDEYWANAEKAKAAGKFTSAFFTDDAGDSYAAVNAANKVNWFSIDGDAWKVGIDSDEAKKVANDWQKSIEAGATVRVKRWDKADFDEKVKNHQLIGYIGAAWEAAFNLDALGVKEAKWHVDQVPGGSSGPWGGSAVVVLKSCQYPEQALKFANWYNTNLKDMASQGLVPAAKGKVDTPENIKALYGGQDVMEVLAKAADLMNSQWAYSPTWPAVKKGFNDNAAANMSLLDNIAAAQKTGVSSLEAAGIKVAK